MTSFKNVYIQEHRACGKCAYFSKDDNSNVIGICSHNLMVVTSKTKITFDKNKGSCFAALKEFK